MDLIADPLSWRPISVTSLVLRTWLKVMARRLGALLERMLPEEVHGFRHTDSTATTHFLTMLRFEASIAEVQRSLKTQQCEEGAGAKAKGAARLKGRRCCISYDLWKCFDSIRRRVSWKILRTWGVDKGTVYALRFWHKLAKRYRKIRGRISGAFGAETGFPQGDPIVPQILQAKILPIIEAVKDQCPRGAGKCVRRPPLVRF